MIWGAFSVSGTMEHEVVHGCQTAAAYVDMSQQASLLTVGPHLCGNDRVFQNDSGGVHNARWTKVLFQENGAILLVHSAYLLI